MGIGGLCGRSFHKDKQFFLADKRTGRRRTGLRLCDFPARFIPFSFFISIFVLVYKKHP